jgi:hypothetical protein
LPAPSSEMCGRVESHLGHIVFSVGKPSNALAMVE